MFGTANDMVLAAIHTILSIVTLVQYMRWNNQVRRHGRNSQTNKKNENELSLRIKAPARQWILFAMPGHRPSRRIRNATGRKELRNGWQLMPIMINGCYVAVAHRYSTHWRAPHRYSRRYRYSCTRTRTTVARDVVDVF